MYCVQFCTVHWVSFTDNNDAISYIKSGFVGLLVYMSVTESKYLYKMANKGCIYNFKVSTEVFGHLTLNIAIKTSTNSLYGDEKFN